jgi:hypothetical protein
MSDTLILAIVAVAGSLGGVLVGKFWDRSAEQQRWDRERASQHEQFLRERRSDAYVRFLAAAHRLYVHSPHNPNLAATKAFRGRESEVLDDLNALTEAYAQVETFGTESAMTSTRALFGMTASTGDAFPAKEAWAAMWATTRAQFRADLRVKN